MGSKSKGRHQSDSDWNSTMISLAFILFFLTIVIIISINHFNNLFDVSSKMILYKETAEDYYPSALYDRNDRIHVVWMSDKKGDWNIYYTLIENQVLKRDFNNLTTSPDDELFPHIAEDEAGNIWVIWVRRSKSNEDSICGKILTNRKADFNEEKLLISSEDKCEKKSPSLLSIGSERLLLAWISKSENKQEIKYTIIQNSYVEQPKKLCTINGSRRVNLARTADHRVFALWDSMSVGRNILHFSVFDEQSGYFSGPQPLISSTGEMVAGDSASIVIRRKGPSMLFIRNENSDLLCSTESHPQDESGFPIFSQPIVIDDTPALEENPVAIEDSSGRIYLFWTSDYCGDNEIFCCCDASMENLQKNGIQYETRMSSADEEAEQFIKNLTFDPNQQNSNPEGYFCRDIFFSVSIIGEKLWVTWDSYCWDPVERNNVRKIKYMETADGYQWSLPITLVDSSKSRKIGRDDRHPAVVQTEDGTIWLFWHSDRYRVDEEDDNFEICFIRSNDGGESWEWKIENEDPFRLTKETSRDMCPAVSSIDDKVLVVWQSDRCGNWDIFYSEFDIDSSDSPSTQRIVSQDVPDVYPSIAVYKGRHLGSPIQSEEHIVISWESAEGVNSLVQILDLKSSNKEPEISSFTIYGRFPDICYISGHWAMGKILSKDLWLVWQSGESTGKATNIFCKKKLSIEEGTPGRIKITNDFSYNERPQIIEFKGKNWIFWDSNGGGNGRGIYYTSMCRKSFPFQRLIISSLIISWILFSWEVKSRKGLSKFLQMIYRWIEKWSKRHETAFGFIMGVLASIVALLACIAAQFIWSNLG